MIKEEMMKENRSILKCLLQHGRAPEYMYSKCINNIKKRKNVDNESTEKHPESSVRFGRVPKNEKERIRQAMEKASNHSPQQECSDEVLIHTITRSHVQSSAVADESIRDIIRRAEQSPRIANIDPASSNCPLNPYVGSEDFQQKFSPIVREVVGFAKNIPGFTEVRHEDKITLLRACVFEVLLIRFASLIDAKNRRMITISGYIIYANIYANIKASNDFVNTLFTFVERINALSLTDEEMALFTAAIVINPKRQGLLEGAKITCIHKRIVHCLHIVMQRERPNNPNLCQELIGTLNDLWILNGMHSKQTQTKHKLGNNGDSSMDMPLGSHHHEMVNNQFQSYSDYSELQNCPIRFAAQPSPEYDDKRMHVDEGCPTSPTSTFSPDEEMRSPGSADSGCSTDSGCSIESGCSSDSGCSVTSHTNEHSRASSVISEHREVISSPDDETTEKLRTCHIKRKTNMGDESSVESEKNRQMSWHKPQKVSEKSAADSPVLRKCLEAPSTLKMNTFNEYYQGHGSSHRHKKFRPALDRVAHPHEMLDSNNCSPRSSTTSSPSYSTSPSPSSSISSSPLRVSSSPYSSSPSNPSSPGNASSILAHRLALPINSKNFPKTSSLLQFGPSKSYGNDTHQDCIMSGQTKTQRHHVMAAPSPSRYDDLRTSVHSQNSHMMSLPMNTSPPPSHHNSPPHNYSSPPLASGHIPQAHSPPAHTPTGLGASALSSATYMCDNQQPLNLSTKTPSPPPAMEA